MIGLSLLARAGQGHHNRTPNHNSLEKKERHDNQACTWAKEGRHVWLMWTLDKKEANIYHLKQYSIRIRLHA